MPKVIYEAQEKQRLFHNSTAAEVLYGGAAGGGKSYAILWDAVDFALTHEHVRVALFRRTFPELEKSLIFTALSILPNNWYKYNKQDHRLTLLKTKSSLEFNHCQYEEDVFKFQSAEYDRIYFDELTHFTYTIYLYLLSRLRTTKSDIKPQAKSASNPGGVGHLWVKQRFIDDVIPNRVCKKVDPESGVELEVEFVPARVSDNQFIYENDPSYIKRLQGLPTDQRKALLEGDWDIFAGQFFKEWRREFHTCEPFNIPTGWTKFGCLDWGYRNPTCFVWGAKDPASGRIFFYRELYFTQKTDEETAELIKGASIDSNGRREKLSYIVADPSLWSVTQFERGESLAMRFSRFGLPLIKGDNNRTSGASLFHAYLACPENDRPLVQFFTTCHNCIRTIPALVYSQRNSEDVDTEGEDHAYDATRYGLMSHPLSAVAKKTGPKENSFLGLMRKIKEAKHPLRYVGRS